MLRITLLGQAVIEQDDGAALRFRSQKEAALLIYLAHTGQTHSRESLADLLWNARTSKQSLTNLRTALARLRTQTDGVLVIERKTLAYVEDLRLSVDSVRVQEELRVIKECHTAEDAARLRGVLALYAGDFLAGFYLDDAPRFNEWVVVERETLRRQAAAGYQLLIDYALCEEQYSAGVEAATRLLALDVLNEAAHGALMECLAASGQTAAALTQYARLTDLLEAELGVEPAAATTARYQRILRGDQEREPQAGPLSALALHGFPIQTHHFVGRAPELAALTGYLSQVDHPLITVSGPGGMGKSSLVIEAVQQLVRSVSLTQTNRAHGTPAERWRDGLFFVSLAEVSDVVGLTNLLVESLHLTFQAGAGDEASQLLAYLRDKAMLLVLDNFEQVTAGADLLTHLLAAAPDVQLLVTSRHLLEIAGETALPLGGLDTLPVDQVADRLDADALHAGAVQLFLQSARRTDLTFAPHIDELPAINRIGRLVQGMPLAIILAATWVDTLAPTEIAAEIERDVALLAAEKPELPPRQRSIQATFNYSWQLLTEDERRILGVLALLLHGFSLALAQAYADASLRELQVLIRKSLIARDLESGRFALHPLLRQFALEKLAEQGLDAAKLHARAVAALEELHSDDRAPVYADLAHHTLAAGMHEKARIYLQRAADDALARHRYGLAAMNYSRALDLTPIEDLAARFALLLAREEARHWQAQRGGQAEDLAGLTALAASMVEDEESRARAVTIKLRTARFAEATSDHEASRQAAQQAVKLAESTTNPELIARSRLAWAIALARLAEYDAAGEQLALALAIARAAGLAEIERASLRNLGADAAYQGDFSAARDYFEQGLALARRTDDPGSARQALGNLGVIARMLGDLDAARAYLEETLPLFRQIGDRRGELFTLNNLGVVAHQRGDFATAEVYYGKALAISRQIRDRQSESETLTQLGHLALDQDQSFQASRHFEAARDVARGAELAAYVIEAQAGLAAATLAQGDLRTALALAQEYLHDIQHDGLASAEDPLRAYFYCYQVLQAGRDPRAAATLAAAVALLEEQAARIEAGPARAAFLANVPINRQIMAAG